jgi:hypothetical protein
MCVAQSFISTDVLSECVVWTRYRGLRGICQAATAADPYIAAEQSVQQGDLTRPRTRTATPCQCR